MIRINLIPYRDARRQHRILQHFTAALSVVGLAIFISLVAHFYGSSTLTGLKYDLVSLQAQNRLMGKKIGKIRNLDKLRANVQRKLALVDQLQDGRFRSMETLLALSHAIPEDVWLLSINDSGKKIELTGMGESNKAVANFMRALDHEPEFSEVSLRVIQRQTIGQVPVRHFSLKMQRVKTSDSSAQSTGGKPS